MSPWKVAVLRTPEDWERIRGGGTPAVLFKFSPRCPVSFAAEAEYDAWLASLPEAPGFAVARVDVVAARELSRAIGQALGVRHESPQAIGLAADGKVLWHASHDGVNAAALRKAVSPGA